MNSEKIICVTVLSGPLKDRKFLIKPGYPPILIGRGEEAEIRVNYDDYCSRNHANIYWENNACFVEDLNSSKGTFINDVRIRGKNELKDKDVIGLGATKLVVAIVDPLDDSPGEEINVPGFANKIKVGDSIYGRYEVHHILAGAIGLAYACYDNLNRTPCVLKTLHRKYFTSAQNQAYFERETATWIGLGKYPYIVSASLLVRIENCPFVVLDYVAPDENGRNTLCHYLSNLTLPEILKYAIEFCYGMEYAYAKMIIAHGDIKPNNIIITSDKTVRITDFGLAKFSQKMELSERIPEKIDSDLYIFKSKSGKASGTLPYMAPEQFDGQMNQSSDIYSFGIVLYQMAANGVLPFAGKNLLEYEELHKNAAVAHLDSPLFAVIAKCLEKDPNKRYVDFATVRVELEGLFLRETGKKMAQLEGIKLDAWEMLNKGVSLYYLGRHEEGIAFYNRAIDINPKDPDTYYNRGNAYYAKGNLEQAVFDYNKAIEINPVYFKAYYNRGVFHHAKGNFEQAISDYNKAIEINPKFLDIYYKRGNAYHAKGDLEQAIADYNKAIEINPQDPNAYYNRGAIYNARGKLAQAIFDYSKVIEISPAYPKVYYNRGIAYYAKGNFEQAIADYNKAIETSPKDFDIYYNRGSAYHAQGDLDQAIADYNKAIEINPKDFDIYHKRGDAYNAKGDVDQAISDYDRAIEINPKDPDTYYSRGNIHHAKGDFEQAISDYSKAIAINPVYFKAYYNRGVFYHTKGSLSKAIADYDKAIEINPKDPNVYYNRGIAYYAKGDLDQAISDYNNVVEINSVYPKIYYSLGIAYYAKGDLEQAIFDYDKAIAVNPKDPDVYYKRGIAYYAKGKLDQAISDYSKAIEINPEHSKAYTNRATAYFLKKNYDKSWQDVHKVEELGHEILPGFINDLKRASGRRH